MFNGVYEPSDDTRLLLEMVDLEKIKNTDVLDVCTGSGVVGIFIGLKAYPRKIIFIDIDYKALMNVSYNLRLFPRIKSKAVLLQCDLLQCIKEKSIDVITANPPYLPGEHGYIDVESGKKGYEIPCRIAFEASRALRKNGVLYMVFSSLSMKEKVLECINKAGFKVNRSIHKHLFFEDIIAIEAVK